MVHKRNRQKVENIKKNNFKKTLNYVTYSCIIILHS